jgi:hypothetical protein
MKPREPVSTARMSAAVLACTSIMILPSVLKSAIDGSATDLQDVRDGTSSHVFGFLSALAPMPEPRLQTKRPKDTVSSPCTNPFCETGYGLKDEGLN